MSSSERYWRRRIFAVTWLTYAGFYLCRKNFAVAMPLLVEDLGYTKLDFATIIFVFSLFYAGGQFTSALLSDRFGARLIVGIGAVVSVASNIAMGFAGTLMAFTLLSPLNGLGQSAGWPGLVKTMASWFRPRERGVVMGWWGTSFVLGGSFATIFATLLVTSETFLPSAGWRRSFFLPALALGAVAALFKAVAEGLGEPELVVYNAGAYTPGGILEIAPEDFERCWKVGCYGGFLVGQEAARRMVPRGHGTMLFTGATAALRGGGEPLAKMRADLIRAKRAIEQVKQGVSVGSEPETAADDQAPQLFR